tara:strand:+ start:639 stop:860 length:222 start_codon:yes stop_codon:yes gene_type:complete
MNTKKLPKELRKWASIIVGYHDCRSSDEGVWVHLAEGWCNPIEECHMVREDTMEETIAAMQCVERCTCDYCPK